MPIGMGTLETQMVCSEISTLEAELVCQRLKKSVKYLKIRIFFLGLRGSYWRGKDCGPNDEVKGCDFHL